MDLQLVPEDLSLCFSEEIWWLVVVLAWLFFGYISSQIFIIIFGLVFQFFELVKLIEYTFSLDLLRIGPNKTTSAFLEG